MSKRNLSIAFQTNKTAQEYISLAKQVNQYDFDVVSVYCDAPFHPSYGPLLLMAPHIERARLGAAAISPSRIHPIDIAANTALLASIAQGGVYIGIARGAWLDAHGISELQPPIQGIREAIDIVRYMLEGREEGYDGTVFKLEPHVRATYPLPDGHVPLLIGTWGPKLGALAGEMADEVKIGGSANPDVVPIIRKYINRGEEKAGRNPGAVGIVMGAVTAVDEDRDQARSLIRREMALYLPVVAKLDPTVDLEPELVARLEQHVSQHEYDEAARLISDDLLNKFAFAGDVDDIVMQCEALFDAGLSRIEFGTPHGLRASEGIRLLGEKVLPAMRRS